jgi:hypothetical protein
MGEPAARQRAIELSVPLGRCERVNMKQPPTALSHCNVTALRTHPHQGPLAEKSGQKIGLNISKAQFGPQKYPE